MSKFVLDLSTLEDTNTTLSRNVRDKSPSDAAPRLTKTDILFAPLLKPSNAVVLIAWVTLCSTNFGDKYHTEEFSWFS